MGSRVVKPETKKLTISEGEWLLVKKRLNHGEQSQAFQRRYEAQPDGVRVNLKQVEMAQITAYLVDWSMVDLQNEPIVIRNVPIEDIEAALNSFDSQTFNEIATAIKTHELAMLAERNAEKNGPAGENASPAISASPAPVTGASSGSESSTKTNTPS